MWPTLKSIVKILPEGTVLTAPEEKAQETARGAFIWDGKSFPQFSGARQILLAEPEEAFALLHWGGAPFSKMSALLTRSTASEALLQRLLKHGVSIIFLPEDVTLSQAAAAINTYILSYVSHFLSGEFSNSEWPDFSTLYFSSHFENILNGMQYVDIPSGISPEQPQVFPNGPYLLLLLHPEQPPKSHEERSVLACALLSHLDAGVKALGKETRIPVSVREDCSLVCLLCVKSGEEYHTLRKAIPSFVGKLRGRCMADGPHVKLSAVYSTIFHDLRHIYISYQECLFSHTLYADLYGTGYTLCAEDMKLYFQFLRQLDRPKSTYYHDRCWKLLEEHDLKNKSDLAHTLDVFLKLNGKIVEASESLGIHRNTMRNRLLSIEQILGINLSDSETVFRLSVCLRLKAIARATSRTSWGFRDPCSPSLDILTPPLSNEIALAYGLLNRYDATSESVISLLRAQGLPHASIKQVESNGVFSDFLRILIPGVAGKSVGMNAPTIGIVGRLSGIKLEGQPLSLVSDADGAIAAIALALSLGRLCRSGEGPLGDVIISTQIALQSSSQSHHPAALTASPIDTRMACAAEVDPLMDAVLSIAVCRATRWVNADGISITPTVKEGYILPPCDGILDLLESVTGRHPVIFPLTTYDITPAGNGLYHVNSIMQPSLETESPVVGVALTSVNLVPGTTPRHNNLADVELAIRFVLEVIYGFTSGGLEFYNKEEFLRAKSQYGDISLK